MLGRDLVAAGAAAGLEVFGYDLPEIDIARDASGLDKLPDADWLVNCAAYTDVDGAESAVETALAVNRDGARRVAAWCAARKVNLLHVSTDYVFDGTGTSPYREDDPTRPVNAYGQSKLAGEQEVRTLCPSALIVRTQSLFGLHGRHFVQAILTHLESGKRPLRVVDDQTSCPTYTVHLADSILRLLNSGKHGIVHVSASGHCTWYEFACAIVAAVGPGTEVVPVSSREYRRPARRPALSVLDKTRYTSWTNHEMPSWKAGLAQYLKATGVHHGKGS